MTGRHDVEADLRDQLLPTAEGRRGPYLVMERAQDGVRWATSRSRCKVSSGVRPRARSRPRWFWQSKSNRAPTKPNTKPIRVVRAVSTRWAATSWTDHPGHSDDSSHASASRVPRSPIKAARSACTIDQIWSTGISFVLSPREGPPTVRSVDRRSEQDSSVRPPGTPTVVSRRPRPERRSCVGTRSESPRHRGRSDDGGWSRFRGRCAQRPVPWGARWSPAASAPGRSVG